jgi:hypothetical protein
VKLLPRDGGLAGYRAKASVDTSGKGSVVAELALPAPPAKLGNRVQTPRYAAQTDPARNNLFDRARASPIFGCTILRTCR